MFLKLIHSYIANAIETSDFPGPQKRTAQKAQIPSNMIRGRPQPLLITYIGGQLKRYGKNVSFCVSATTEIMKTNNVPLKRPITLLPEMKKKL